MGWKFQKPVAQEKPPAHREGDVHEGEVCRARHPAYGWGWYVVEDYVVEENNINFNKPLHWVDEAPDDPEDGSGHWVFAKDCD